MKVALVYDRVNKIGGAERVLQVLHEMYPTAPLYTAVYNRETARWADGFDPSTHSTGASTELSRTSSGHAGSGPGVRTTFLQHIPWAKTNHEYFAWLAPMAFEGLDFSEFDVVISVTSEYAKGIITKPGTLHICYCLTPTRYLWSGYETYFNSSLTRFLTKPLVSYLRMWDKVAAARPDYYIAISKTVKDRIKKYYERESVIMYPPVTLDTRAERLELSKKRETNLQALSSNNFFLIVSRLVPYKRIDIAIEAFNKLGWKLKIVGTGREYARLKWLAGPTIEFAQNLTDGQLIRYYQDCTALIFPGEEDLGLAILEAQNFGKPVIAYRAGGAVETVIDEKTGLFFYPQTVDALIKSLKTFNKKKFDPENCVQNAQRFSMARFKREFMTFVEKGISNSKSL